MGRVPRLVLAYFAQYLKRQMSYRGNFALQTISLLSWAAVNLALIHFLYLQVPAIQGWTYPQVLLIYGVAQTSFGLSFLCFAALLWLPSRFIVEGQLDRLLVRPLDPFLQLLMEQFSAEDLMLAIVGLVIIGFALNQQGVVLHAGTWLMVLGVVFTGALVYGGLMTLVASFSFWLKDRVGLLGPLLESSDQVSRYPLTIYPLWLRTLLSSLLPLGFVAFYPAQWFLGRAEYQWATWASPLVGMTILSLGYITFHRGLRRYESAGS